MQPALAAYDPHTALLVVDVQNDFADPAGALYVPGGERAVDAVNREIERALAAGAFVAYTQDWHPERTPHFVTDGGPWPPHCVRDSWGAALHPRLHAGAGPVVRKGAGGEDGYSGFSVRDPRTEAQHATALEQLLRDHAVRAVVVVGLATDYCVRETALDAVRLGFATTVVLDAVRAVDVLDGDGDAALAALRAVGVALV
ncbi:MAG: isochorismatase family protein [Dehalococcoidia bacterium]|nr:isochorismatase family protein [Dehalococcoidia bacterium]